VGNRFKYIGRLIKKDEVNEEGGGGGTRSECLLILHVFNIIG